VDWGTYAHRGKDAVRYRELAEQHRGAGRPLEAALFAGAATGSELRGPNVTPQRVTEATSYGMEIGSIEDYEATLGTWTTADGDHEIYFAKLITTRNDFNVHMTYQSHASKQDTAAIEAEAALLHEVLQREHPTLAEELDAVLWAAGWQAPTNPKVQYPVYNVAIPLEAG
jgi:hypothetical protein